MNQKRKRTGGNKVGTIFDKNDMFSIPIPTFTIEGEENIGTMAGSILSLTMVIIVVSYALPKGFQMVNKVKAEIFENIDDFAYEGTEIQKLSDYDFQMAFGV